MTTDDHAVQIAALERRLAAAEACLTTIAEFFTFGRTPDHVPWCTTAGRMGIMTRYWCEQPRGQGAALSIGTEVDRFAMYAEIDRVTCHDHPTTAVYAAVVAPNVFHQNNIAIEAYAANSPVNVGMYTNTQGIQLDASVQQFEIGKLGGLLRPLWP